MPKSEISAPYNKHSGYMREPNEKKMETKKQPIYEASEETATTTKMPFKRVNK